MIGDAIGTFMQWASTFFFEPVAVVLSLFPIMGAVAWTIGGLFYRFFYVGKFRDKDFVPIAPEDQPLITIMNRPGFDAVPF